MFVIISCNGFFYVHFNCTSLNFFNVGTSHSYRSTATAAAAATLALSTTSASERTFPPQTGFTYSGWVFLEVLPAVPSHMSAVGLLTVEKHWEDLSTRRLVNSSILQIYFDLQSKSLVVGCLRTLISPFVKWLTVKYQ